MPRARPLRDLGGDRHDHRGATGPWIEDGRAPGLVRGRGEEGQAVPAAVGRERGADHPAGDAHVPCRGPVAGKAVDAGRGALRDQREQCVVAAPGEAQDGGVEAGRGVPATGAIGLAHHQVVVQRERVHSPVHRRRTVRRATSGCRPSRAPSPRATGSGTRPPRAALTIAGRTRLDASYGSLDGESRAAKRLPSGTSRRPPRSRRDRSTGSASLPPGRRRGACSAATPAPSGWRRRSPRWPASGRRRGAASR